MGLLYACDIMLIETSILKGKPLLYDPKILSMVADDK